MEKDLFHSGPIGKLGRGEQRDPTNASSPCLRSWRSKFNERDRNTASKQSWKKCGSALVIWFLVSSCTLLELGKLSFRETSSLCGLLSPQRNSHPFRPTLQQSDSQTEIRVPLDHLSIGQPCYRGIGLYEGIPQKSMCYYTWPRSRAVVSLGTFRGFLVRTTEPVFNRQGDSPGCLTPGMMDAKETRQSFSWSSDAPGVPFSYRDPDQG